MAKKSKDLNSVPAEETEVENVEKMEPVVPEKIEFEEWFALREAQIPPQHRKEILMADFKGRKLSMKETVQVFDEALKRYGVKLN